MDYDILVLEVISNGPEGYPKDEVIDIGISGIDFKTSRIDSVYSAIVRHDISGWNDDKKDVVTAQGILLDDIALGIPADDVRAHIKEKIHGIPVASFDVRNVFTKYMVNDPWDFTKEITIMPSIASRLPPSLGCKVPSEENMCIRNAYNRLFEDDPMDIGSRATALDHALMASAILLRLKKNGRY